MTSLLIGIMLLGLWLVYLASNLLPGLQHRPCAGRAWRRSFPQASKTDIRCFLQLFVDAFALPRRHALRFSPADKLMDIYRELYPSAWMPDALELETLLVSYRERYGIDSTLQWHDALTLGDVFAAAHRPPATRD